MLQVDSRLQNIEKLVIEVLDNAKETGHRVRETTDQVRETREQVNEKLDVLQDDFDAQRKMLRTLKRSLQCRMTRRRIVDWVLSMVCLLTFLYVYVYARALG